MLTDLSLTERGDKRRRSGDLWLNRGDVDDDSGDLPSGSVVDLLSPDGHFRGRGFYNARSSVAVRVVSDAKVSIDESFFGKRIQSAMEYRENRCSGLRSFRVVHGDGDYLPGLVVDCYGEYLVVQFRHPTVEEFESTIADVLEQEFSPRSIYCRNDFEARQEMGLDSYSKLLRGEEVPDRVPVLDDPFSIVADLKNGQKTGFYLDQNFNRRAFADYINDGRGIDCFSYSGGWGLTALDRGADHVTFVDSSSAATDLVQENLRRNGWSESASIQEKDCFDYLNDRSEKGNTTDFIALDPPAFARNSSGKGRALKGYKEINLRAMQLLKEGGFLATNTCSAPVTRDDFIEVVRESADDAHVSCRVLEDRTQGPDHPWLPRIPRTLYLQSMICEISLS
ncbi:MAG: class I SAM-dependent rRNA methyltransferase [bacterium]